MRLRKKGLEGRKEGKLIRENKNYLKELKIGSKVRFTTLD